MARMDEKQTKTSLRGIFLATTACCFAAAVWQSEIMPPGLKFVVTLAACSFSAALMLSYSVTAGIATGTLALILLDISEGIDLLGFAMTWFLYLAPIWAFSLLGKELRIYLSA